MHANVLRLVAERTRLIMTDGSTMNGIDKIESHRKMFTPYVRAILQGYFNLREIKCKQIDT